jgi:hypothetical protein
MDLTAFSERLRAQLLGFAWDEWAQMGISAVPRRRSCWAQDPEALIVFTLEVARSDPRLFDELLDWMLRNESLLTVRRLRAVCIDDTDRALVAGAMAWLARRRPRARLPGSEKLPAPPDLEELFEGGVRVRNADPDFAAAGFMRPVVEPSGKSLAPDFASPINLAFRLRAILGVGIRAEVVRVLLCTDAPQVTASALARSSVYAKRNVHDALTGLVDAGVVSAFTVGGEQRYTIDKPAWGALLGVASGGMPRHKEWPQLLGVLRTILRWSRRDDVATASEYMQASAARQLLDALRPELAFAGVTSNLRVTAEQAPGALEAVIAAILSDLQVAPPADRAMDTAGGVEIDETLSVLRDQDALADISEADEAYRQGDVVRGVDAVRRLRGSV